jgi:hypothetical protein
MPSLHAVVIGRADPMRVARTDGAISWS